MAQLNYQNPEASYPLQTVDARSPALGAGTVPGSFLAGTMLPQRMQDYRDNLDISQTSGRLANQRTGAELQDYLANSGNRQLERIQHAGDLTSQIGLQPDQHLQKTQNLKADIEAGRYQNEVKVWSATQALPEAQREQTMKHLEQTSTILRGLPENVDPTMQLQILKKFGQDTSHWDGQDPSLVSHQLQAIRGMNPDVFKHLSDMQKTEFEQKSHMERTGAEITGRETVGTAHNAATIEAARISASGKLQHFDVAAQAVKRQIMSANPELSEQDASDRANVELFRMSNDPNYRFSAQEAAKAKGTASLLDSLKGKGSPNVETPPIPGTTKTQSSGSKMTIPDIGEVDVLMKNPDGSVRFRDPKSGRTGTWKP